MVQLKHAFAVANNRSVGPQTLPLGAFELDVNGGGIVARLIAGQRSPCGSVASTRRISSIKVWGPPLPRHSGRLKTGTGQS